MKVLIYTTRSLNGVWIESLRQQLKVVETIADEADILLTTKTENSVGELSSAIQFKLNPVHYYRDRYFDEVVNMNSWEDAYDDIDVEPLLQYDKIIIFGGLLSDASGAKLGGKSEYRFPHNMRNQINFITVGLPKYHMLALNKAHHHGVEVHEVIYDPQELSMDRWHELFQPKENYYKYHGYEDSRYNFNRLDSLQYYYKNIFNMEELDSNKKDIDFTFGYTCVTKERKWVSDEIEQICSMFDTYKLFAKDKIKGIDTSIPRKKYLEYIARSKYTLIIPAYDVTSMSIYRIIESLELNCLPLFHANCNIELIEKSFDVNLSNLIINDEYKPLTDDERYDIIKQLKNKICNYEKGFK